MPIIIIEGASGSSSVLPPGFASVVSAAELIVTGDVSLLTYLRLCSSMAWMRPDVINLWIIGYGWRVPYLDRIS